MEEKIDDRSPLEIATERGHETGVGDPFSYAIQGMGRMELASIVDNLRELKEAPANGKVIDVFQDALLGVAEAKLQDLITIEELNRTE